MSSYLLIVSFGTRWNEPYLKYLLLIIPKHNLANISVDTPFHK